MIPNKDQFYSMLRSAGIFLGGVLVTKGFLTAEQLDAVFKAVAEIAGPIATLIPIVVGLYTHTKKATVQRAADIVPISAPAQAMAGIETPQTTPTNPKKL